MKSDIQDRADIRKLVISFYERLLKEEDFKHIFLEVMEVDMLAHLDKLIDFWDSTLFQAGVYKGDTVEAHLEVHHQHRLNASHFSKWLEIFNETVNDLFAGNIATQAKQKASTLATIIRLKIDNLEQRRLEINN
ncbi:MAG: group III truncated hemoglobin [Saprospiraceae bacterium]|nr:group III truncated hemoglobin [Saprospiraceae bacterium]